MYNCVAMQLVTGKHWLNIKPLAVLLGIGKRQSQLDKI